MERNLDLMVQVRDWAVAHPEEHLQDEWRVINCKTKMCIGGAAAEFAGGRWLTKNPLYMEVAGHYLVPEPEDDPEQISKISVGGRTRLGIEAYQRGRRVLGLTEEEADTLFVDRLNESDAIDYLNELIRKERERRRSAARRAAQREVPGGWPSPLR